MADRGFTELVYTGGEIITILFQLLGALAAMYGWPNGNQRARRGIGRLITGMNLVPCSRSIIGGIKSIARVTEKVVPFMGVIYVLPRSSPPDHLDGIGWAFGQIFTGAFTGLGVLAAWSAR